MGKILTSLLWNVCFLLLSIPLIQSEKFGKGCYLTVGQICDSLSHIDVSDPMQVDVTCSFIRKKMDPMCQDMCECIAHSYDTTCTESECNEQRQNLLCRIGAPYFSDLCPSLLQCLCNRSICDKDRSICVPELEDSKEPLFDGLYDNAPNHFKK
eukprot:c14091_g1_i1.p1 GENE.c14091_g1_i1~~c14091_g1_i1.p1  ORF type:complete len:161 (-),score=45.85 c14091_g1_i1:133-594(-)